MTPRQTQITAGLVIALAGVLATPHTAAAPGAVQWFSGKPPGVLEIPTDSRWRDLPGLTEPPTGTTGRTELRELYLRIHLPRTNTGRTVCARFVRSSGDATANTCEQYTAQRATIPFAVIHFEQGEGQGGHWQIRATGPGTITAHTRYAKQHTIG